MTSPMVEIAGCGWTKEIAETTGCPELTRGNDAPCCARDGHRGPVSDRPTVGVVGLCIGCLEAPADLLAALSVAVDNATASREADDA
jgi:hypothetical protein